MERKWSDMIDGKMRKYLFWSAAGMALGYGYYSLLGLAGSFGPLPFSPFPAILLGGMLGWLGFGSIKDEKERASELEPAFVRVKAGNREGGSQRS